MTDSPNDQPEPFDLNSDDVAARKRADLKRLFPEVFNEDKLDFDQLRRVMGDWVDEGSERFGLTWPGKAACMKVIQAPATGALRPDRDESVKFDESENVFIEGDNLEVLKLLQKAYFGKAKLIYIDPPYNTGREFIYPDRYAENLETYLAYTGQVDDEGREFSTNSDKFGRFHTRWLNMMYPRLYLAKNLMRDDGLIMISIDENELPRLLAICDQIFGQENFVECLVYDKKAAPKGVPPVNMIVGVHEYIVCYQKSDKFAFLGTPRSVEGFDNPDSDPRGLWRNTNCKSTTKDASEAFEIADPKTGNIFKDTWAFSRSEMERMAKTGELIFPKNRDGQVRKKEYFDEFGNANIPVKSSLGLYDAQYNTQLLTTLMGGKYFQNAKHINLMKFLIDITTKGDDLIVDFFAGSGSTMHACLLANSEDGGARKFLAVQLPELIEEGTEAAEAGYRNIAQLGRERIRRAAKDIAKQNSDIGFRAFSLASSAFQKWDANSDARPEDLVERISAYAKQVTDTEDEDILFEILLKDGFELNTKVEEAAVTGGKIYSVADGALLICLERYLTKETIDALADLAEEKDAARVVCLDAGFQGNDQLKTNAVQTFKSRLGHGEDGSMFRTV